MSGKKKKGDHGGGGHGGAWVITFADLVSLLMAFFVMLLSFSVQDQQKVATVAGSMRDAFGIQPVDRKAGMIEREGLPERDYYRSVAERMEPEDAELGDTRKESKTLQGPELTTHDIAKAEQERKRQFATAAQTIRQAWADRPDLTELSKDVSLHITKDGLEISLIDQDGSTMFELGSIRPTAKTQALLGALGPVLRQMANPIRVIGHTSAARESDRFGKIPSQWTLSSQRADAVRDILLHAGMTDDRFESVVGRGSRDPLFPSDPFQSANRRIEIILLNADAPLPSTFQP